MKTNPFLALPDYVFINGQKVHVNTDFRVGIAIEMEMTGENPDVIGLLKQFYLGKVPENIEQALNAMIGFFAHHDGDGSRAKGSAKSGRSYDFEADADALLASFLDTYGIDLTTAKIHWWTFRRLMLNLPGETPFMRRVHYRTADLRKLGKEQRKHYKKMRELYGLKKQTVRSTTVQEREAALREKIRRRQAEAQRNTEKG